MVEEILRCIELTKTHLEQCRHAIQTPDEKPPGWTRENREGGEARFKSQNITKGVSEAMVRMDTRSPNIVKIGGTAIIKGGKQKKYEGGTTIQNWKNLSLVQMPDHPLVSGIIRMEYSGGLPTDIGLHLDPERQPDIYRTIVDGRKIRASLKAAGYELKSGKADWLNRKGFSIRKEGEEIGMFSALIQTEGRKTADLVPYSLNAHENHINPLVRAIFSFGPKRLEGRRVTRNKQNGLSKPDE